MPDEYPVAVEAIPVLDPRLSSWGNPENEVDLRTARRLNAALRTLVLIGETACMGLIPLLLVSAVFGLTTINFENGRISDGTDYSCYLDGKTGQIVGDR